MQLAYLHNCHEDMAYLRKQLLQENGTLPGLIDEQDYFRFLETINAQPADKRIWHDPKADAAKFM
jgi:hypothetical protein